MLALVSAVAVLAVSAFVAVVILLKSLKDSRDQTLEALNEAEAETIRAETATAEAVRQREVAEAQKSRAEKALYVSLIRSADESWDRGNIDEAWRNLDAAHWNLRGWEHDFLYSKFTRGQTTLRGHTNAISSVGFSPDETRIVSDNVDDTVKV